MLWQGNLDVAPINQLCVPMIRLFSLKSQIVKFARKGEPKVAAVSDSDVDIVR